MIKKNEGITLVSLTVTVILLLVLAGMGLNVSYLTVKDVRNNRLNTELGMVRQAITERYSMAVAVNKANTRISEPQISFWVGQKVEASNPITLPERTKINWNQEAEDFYAKYDNYNHEYQEEFYYRLSPEDLEEIGIAHANYTYIVNYKTGEVYNETKKIDRDSNLLYLPAKENSEEETKEDTHSFNDW